MFDEEKEVLNQQAEMLEKELTFKVNILNKIKSSSQVVFQKNNVDNIEPQLELQLQRVQSERVELKGSKKLKITADTVT